MNGWNCVDYDLFQVKYGKERNNLFDLVICNNMLWKHKKKIWFCLQEIELSRGPLNKIKITTADATPSAVIKHMYM